MRSVRTLILMLAFASACGPTVTHYDYADGGVCEEGMTLCEGECVSLDSDRLNCGACGYMCPTGSNACVSGTCVCKATNPESTVQSADVCDYPAVCDQTGYCLTPDPLGETCDEIENIHCNLPGTDTPDPTRACVEGFCTLIDCDHEEVCNLRDDNCDGLTDQSAPDVYLTQDCYSGDPATRDVGICHGGTQQCVAGGWTPCSGEQLPTNEDGLLACDGVDGDCNGCVDDHYDEFGNLQCGTPDPKKTDTVFVVDKSGSMSSIISASMSAMSTLVNDFSTATWIRWGLVVVADPTDLIILEQPLDVFSAFLTALGSITIDGGVEPTYDAVVDTATDAFTAPPLGRDASAQLIIIVFGDEAAQTEVGLTESDVCNAVNAAGATLAVFTDPIHYQDWDECALLFPLTSSAADMTTDLNELFEDTCVSVSMFKSDNAKQARKLYLKRKLELITLTEGKISSGNMSPADWSNYYYYGHILPTED